VAAVLIQHHQQPIILAQRVVLVVAGRMILVKAVLAFLGKDLEAA
jgi:hypothetical protein